MRKPVLSAVATAALMAGALTLPHAAWAASACDAVAGNLIVNCGFETGSFSGWTLSGDTNPETTLVVSSYPFPPYISQPHSGTYYALLGPIGAEGYLSQTFNDVAGQLLDVSFYLANDPEGQPSTASLNASFDGSSLLSLTDAPAQAYTLYSFEVTATSRDTLTIGGFRNDAGYFALDDVSVAPATVPEPASMALLSAGLIGLGAARSRKSA